MKKKYEFLFTSKSLLIGFTAFCLLFIGVSFFTDKLAAPLRSVVSTVVVPFQKGMNNIGLWTSDKAATLQEISEVMEKNVSLQSQCFHQPGCRGPTCLCRIHPVSLYPMPAHLKSYQVKPKSRSYGKSNYVTKAVRETLCTSRCKNHNKRGNLPRRNVAQMFRSHLQGRECRI